MEQLYMNFIISKSVSLHCHIHYTNSFLQFIVIDYNYAQK